MTAARWTHPNHRNADGPHDKSILRKIVAITAGGNGTMDKLLHTRMAATLVNGVTPSTNSKSR